MSEGQVFHIQEETVKVPSKRKNVFLILGIIFLLIIVAGIFYLLGAGSKTEEVAEISPTPSEIPTPTIFEEEQVEEILGEVSPTLTKKPTPTSKPTSTPSPTPTPISKVKVITSTASLDGFRSSNGRGDSGVEIRAGRNVNLVTRGFISFDVSSLPAGAKIEESTLRLYQATLIGSPYSIGGSIKVDHLTYGDTLDNADYGASALSSSFVTLTNNTTFEWKDADVTDSVRDDLSNARSRSQFRIHFQIENTGGDASGDFVYFESAENTIGTGNTPQLVIKYQ